jgi:ATP-dependent DNA helicase RecQ
VNSCTPIISEEAAPLGEDTDHLRAALKRHFGYDTFRPLQEEIIRDALAGRDVFALLPTGGGKSLCFQLPAILRSGLTIVVSPLIALMKDQVDALRAIGAPAVFLNSTLEDNEARASLRQLHRGEARLLYVAPERLLLASFLEKLAQWNVAQIAIDEAHCLSEWGHDFRPEYRQLTRLRTLFPSVPWMALTATATERVRADIITHLGLRDARCYVASFNRPNLTYRVLPRTNAYVQTLELIKARASESGIVYCQSRRTTELLAERLATDGIVARPYHAGLTAQTRTAHQELFLRDEVRVICATIAFGMGINKPNVRYVIHHDLPKNIEGYYQETGRAGRDGLPADCILLFNPGDVVKQSTFIRDKTDPNEQRIAREQLQQMVHYAESAACRRVTLLRYFNETFAAGDCHACDNCLSPRENYDGTIHAQKFLSCIYRIRQKSGFAFGLNHVVEVLTGGASEAVRKWSHETLSTFGIGTELSRSEWQEVGRELIRLGLVAQSAEKFTTVTLTEDGLAALKERRLITLSKRPLETRRGKGTSARKKVGAIPCDEALFERLRQLRRKLADERAVPAYIIFSDATLRHLAARIPATAREFGEAPGVGEQKLRDFAEPFLAEIAEWRKARENSGASASHPDVPSSSLNL